MDLDKGFFRSVGIAATAVVLIAASASLAAAFNPRVPQVAFNTAGLQGYLNGVGEAINVATDQVDAQVWTTSVSGNSTMTLMIELAGNAASNSIGVYNTNAGPVPPLFQLFPGAASSGWFATAHFSGGNMTVTLFDNNSIIQGQNFYAGVNANGFGFYISGPGGTFYSEDSRNAGGAAQILTYLGTGVNFGDWWECFEDTPFAGGDQDFDDAVLLLQSVVPTPVDGTTWGRLKTLYRK
jgi:hypothetical protein